MPSELDGRIVKSAPAYRTQALVVRVIPFGETSQIVHLATPEHGLVPALAKGALRPGPEFQGGLTLGGLGEATLAPRRGAELEALTRFRALRDLRALGRELSRYWSACHVLDLLRTWMRPALPNPALYAAGVMSLRALAEAPVSSLASWVLLFEARAVAATGHRPALDACPVCGEHVRRSAVFSPAAGGVAHASCAPPGPRVAVAPGARDALVRLYTARVQELVREPLAAADLRALRAIHDALLPHLLERRPGALERLPRP